MTLIKKTKIIATLGPASNQAATFQKMFKTGVDVIRINMSHPLPLMRLKKTIHTIRRIAKKEKKTISIIMDLCGPKIRINFRNNDKVLKILKNNIYKLGYSAQDIPINYNIKFSDIHKQSFVKIDDGKIQFKILKTSSKTLTLKAMTNGLVTQRKGINFIGMKFKFPSVTDEDKKNIKIAHDLGIDWLAQSFVRNAKNIQPIQRILHSMQSSIPIIAKIEQPEAIENLDSIITAYDGILVARGDLGVEMELSTLPRLQKKIINKCIQYKKPCIVATQMLESMITQPNPTRAEVNDVANAIYDGVDSIMLSAETAIGQFPIESVHMMSSIIQDIESDVDFTNFNRYIVESLSMTIYDNYSAICHAAYSVAKNLKIKTIIVLTDSGKTAIQMAQFRPNALIIAVSPSHGICNQLSMIWGVVPIYIKKFDNLDSILTQLNTMLLDRKLLKDGQSFIVSSGILPNIHGSTNMLKIHTIQS